MNTTGIPDHTLSSKPSDGGGVDAEKIRRGFDLLGGYYDFLLLVLGANLLQKSQTRLWDPLPLENGTRILLIGDGTGFFAKYLIQSMDYGSIDSVEISPRMLSRARKKAHRVMNVEGGLHHGPFQKAGLTVRFHESDYCMYETNGLFDVIVVNYFLDIMDRSQFRCILNRISRQLKPGGILYHTDFTPPGRVLHRPIFRFIQTHLLGFLYRFFRSTAKIKARQLIDIDPPLFRRKYRLLARKTTVFGILTTSIFEQPRIEEKNEKKIGPGEG